MQTKQLLINGINVPLSDRTRIGVTYQANNVGELQNRQGTFTNTFKIPITNESMIAFEWSNLMTSATVIPYRRNLATYIENGVELVSDGEAILKKTDKQFYYLDVVGGNMDLVRAMGDMVVGDLYVEADTHVWNLTNAFNSRTGNDYYIYPLIDWRIDIDTFWTSASADIRQMLPCCVVPEMFDRLSVAIGFTFVGDYLTSDAHLNMVLTPDEFVKSGDTLETETIKSSFTTSGALNMQDTSGFYGKTIPEGSGTATITVTPIHNVLDSDFTIQGYFPPSNEFANLKFTGQFSISWYTTENYGAFESPQNRGWYVIARIKEGGNILAEITYPVTSRELNWDNTDVDSQVVISIETGVIQLIAGNNYFYQLDFVFERHGNIESFARTWVKTSRFEKIPTPAISFGNSIRFADIYRMKVSDVIKDILNLRGVIIQTNSYTKEVQFNFFQDVVDNIPDAKDWSDKIDIRQNELSFKFGRYGQRNNMLFKENENVPNGLGDYYFDVDDQTLDDEIDAVKINHPATVESNRYLGNNIPEIEGIDALNKWQKPGYRLLQIDRRFISFNATFTDGSSNQVTDTDIPYANFVGFEELVPTYYGALIDILQNTKAIVLVTKLTAIDIQELDFTIPIFLDIPQMNINGYFYINIISNYKEGGTSVEYIRL